MEPRIHISRGNTKIGNIPNFNLPPVLTCAEGVPCSTLCYSRKAYEGYARNTCRPAWDANLSASFHLGFMSKMVYEIERLTRKTKLFRVHSSGDFYSKDYLRSWYWIASKVPNVRFLAFTKRYSWIEESEFARPANFQIVRSLWYPMGEISQTRPNALVLGIPGETRTPDFVCPGSCPECAYQCWFMKPGRTVGFNLH